MKKLSSRQERIRQFIGEFFEDNGYPPTVRDIQYACDISSTSVVDYNLNILQREGHIRRSPDISRGIELLDASHMRTDTTKIPVLGFIAAGQPLPVFSSENWGNSDSLESVELPSSQLKGQRDLYALRVHGSSMIDALIDDGDVVVISPAAQVREGDMVIAWLKREKEATLKRLFNDGNQIRLQPANSQVEPIFVDPENIDIQGKVVTVLRDLS